MVRVEVLETASLGDRSYIAHDGSSALVIDPQRDLDRIDAVLRDRGLRLAAVAETHVHNDYVSGGHALAARAGVEHLVCADDPVDFARTRVADGDRHRVGTLDVEVVATPGHTETHLSYVVTGGDGPPAVFTGGSLLFGSVGRTDLVDPGRTRELARAQYRSARRLAAMLPDETQVHPTHGFGSFCSSGAASGADSSTVGEERQANDALTTADEDDFVETLIANLTVYPSYYAHVGPRNLAGARAADLSPPAPLEPAALRRHLADGDWVVDLRDRTLYAAAHLSGTVGIALGDQFPTYLGWLIPRGTPVALIAERPEDVAEAQRQMARIGIDRPVGGAAGRPEDLAERPEDVRSYPVATFAQLAETLGSSGGAGGSGAGAREPILDVRQHDERDEAAIAGSVHVPIQELQDRLDELPSGRLWVHCASGLRAGIAASLLARAGRDVVLVDDDFSEATERGLTTR